MPLTKTAKRALRSSKRKRIVNTRLATRLDVTIRKAKGTRSKELIKKAISVVDKARKRGIIHKNKSNRIKSNLSKLLIRKNPKSVPNQSAT